MNRFYRRMNRRGSGNKYGNKQVLVNGMEFDSMKEANRWAELQLLQRAGKIRDLSRQVKYQLIPVQRDEFGKAIERSVDYIADFQYRDENGKLVVEDAKGFKTKEYIIKRKLMLREYGIRIREV